MSHIGHSWSTHKGVQSAVRHPLNNPCISATFKVGQMLLNCNHICLHCNDTVVTVSLIVKLTGNIPQ